MGQHQLSKELKTFIKKQIHSVFMLEVLLLLHRNQPKSLNALEVATELGIDEKVAEEQLSELVAIELVAQSESNQYQYSYHPSDPDALGLVNDLAIAYSRQRIPVLSLILGEGPDRIRLFAEAFRLVSEHD